LLRQLLTLYTTPVIYLTLDRLRVCDEQPSRLQRRAGLSYRLAICALGSVERASPFEATPPARPSSATDNRNDAAPRIAAAL
jgi:hypothetical protein